MRKYLSTLHKRSDKHKSNFALLVSGGFTLVMFGLWFTLNHSEPEVVVHEGSVRELAATNEVGPLDSLSASTGDAWQNIRENLSGMFDGFGSVDLEEGYEEMKTNTLNTYGR